MEAAGLRHIVYGSRSDEIKIWNISDIHWMNKACAEKKVRSDIEEIKNDPYSFWIGGGDYADFIGYSDKRFHPDSVAPWVSIKDLGNLGLVGMRQIRDLFLPIRHKCLGLLLGNHELKYQLHTEHEGLHAWLCTELEIPDITHYEAKFNLQYCAFLGIVFIRGKTKCPMLIKQGTSKSEHSKKFVIFAHHGAGYAQTAGGKINRLREFMNCFEADCYYCGHVHDKVGRREPVLAVNEKCTEIIQKERLGIISGSYLRTYAQGTTSYGEQRGYRPTSLGAAWCAFRPDKSIMRAEI